MPQQAMPPQIHHCWLEQSQRCWLEQTFLCNSHPVQRKSCLHRTRCQEQVRPSLPSLSHYNWRLPILYIYPHCHPSPSTTAAFPSCTSHLPPILFFHHLRSCCLSISPSLSLPPPPPTTSLQSCQLIPKMPVQHHRDLEHLQTDQRTTTRGTNSSPATSLFTSGCCTGATTGRYTTGCRVCTKRVARCRYARRCHYNCRLPILYMCLHCHPPPTKPAAFQSFTVLLHPISASPPAHLLY